jgi:hypothetical protein
LDFGGLSIVGYSKTGLIPIISTKLSFLNNSSTNLDTFLYRFSTPLGMLLGQGDQYYTGFFGPYPVPNYNDFHAYSFSFYLLDTILGTPRNDLNAFLIAILFVNKNILLEKSKIEDFFNTFFKSLNNLNDLLSKKNFEIFVDEMKGNFFQKDSIHISKEEFPISKRDPPAIFQNIKNNPVFIELQTEPESLIAVPWILHAVYHGLEQATIDILGESSSLLEILMEQYTAEILDRFHLFDTIFTKKNPDVKDALELGVKHLEMVGEKVTITPLDDNKFECSINCSFASAVHPYLPIKKCLWMRYLSAMVRKTLPADKDLYLNISEFDSKDGSRTIIEIVPKVFKTV